jgi:5-methylcytosine-specific restriction endonuclease McrA
VKLGKSQRAALREKFGGRCAYCGEPLGERWHADHIISVQRKQEYVRGKGFVSTGEMYRPENDHVGNLAPACAPCNIDKHSMSLEHWREKLARTLEVLQRNHPTYRHALRFGMLEEKPAPIVFYFERAQAAAQQNGESNE